MTKSATSTKRTRRVFSAAFKQEAVRRLAERRAQGVSVQQISRALDVRPELLRSWKDQLAAQGGAQLHLLVADRSCEIGAAETNPLNQSVGRLS